ncbi:MAG: hypothetical protein ABIM74_05240 [candidate division WOR-3 bacterium]
MKCCHTHEGHGYSHCCGFMHRRYLTRQEEIELLERYLEELKKEMEAVEERLRELKGK